MVKAFKSYRITGRQTDRHTAVGLYHRNHIPRHFAGGQLCTKVLYHIIFVLSSNNIPCAAKTRCSARETTLQGALYFFGQKWKTGTGRQYFTDYSSIFNHCDIIGLKKTVEFGDKTQNNGYYGVQGYSRSSKSIPIESPYASSY